MLDPTLEQIGRMSTRASQGYFRNWGGLGIVDHFGARRRSLPGENGLKVSRKYSMSATVRNPRQSYRWSQNSPSAGVIL